MTSIMNALGLKNRYTKASSISLNETLDCGEAYMMIMKLPDSTQPSQSPSQKRSHNSNGSRWKTLILSDNLILILTFTHKLNLNNFINNFTKICKQFIHPFPFFSYLVEWINEIKWQKWWPIFWVEAFIFH